jgi:hypothetical protein
MKREIIKTVLAHQAQIIPFEKKLRSDKKYKTLLILAWTTALVVPFEIMRTRQTKKNIFELISRVYFK